MNPHSWFGIPRAFAGLLAPMMIQTTLHNNKIVPELTNCSQLSTFIIYQLFRFTMQNIESSNVRYGLHERNFAKLFVIIMPSYQVIGYLIESIQSYI